MTPTLRSKRYLEGLGYLVDDVERWIPRTRIRKDLFGFADLACLTPGGILVLAQVTDDSNKAARRTKIIATEAYKRIKLSGSVKVLLHAWGLRGKRGEKKRWDPNEEWL